VSLGDLRRGLDVPSLALRLDLVVHGDAVGLDRGDVVSLVEQGLHEELVGAVPGQAGLTDRCAQPTTFHDRLHRALALLLLRLGVVLHSRLDGALVGYLLLPMRAIPSLVRSILRSRVLHDRAAGAYGQADYSDCDGVAHGDLLKNQVTPEGSVGAIAKPSLRT